MMEKVLITGVSGFVGVNLANQLLNNENKVVIGVDDFSTSSISNLYSLLKNPRFHFIEGNFSEIDIPFADKIFHLIGKNDSSYVDDKFIFASKQIKIYEKLLELTNQFGSKTVILSDLKDKNSNDVFYNKYIDFIFDYIKEYKAKYNANIKLLKTPKIYGQNISKNSFGIIEKAIFSALNNDFEFKISNDSFENYVYIDDVVQALFIVMEKYIDTFDVSISSNKKVQLSSLIQYIFSVLNAQTKLVIENSEINKTDYEIGFDYLKENFDFDCDNDFEETLPIVIKYIKTMFFY